MKVFYDRHYVGAKHAFDTTRKAAHIAEEIASGRLDGAVLTEPDEGSINNAIAGIERVHTAEYVDAIRTGSDSFLASTQGFEWDPGIWSMAVHSTAGVISAVDAALSEGVAGSLSSGLHHAKPETGAGYCTVNGLVIAAAQHLTAKSDLSIVILDVDAHCGGGTAACLQHVGLAGRVQHLDLVTVGFDDYEPVGPDDRRVYAPREDVGYLAAVNDMVDAIDWTTTDLILHNAGMDPYPSVSISALAERERLIFGAGAAHSTPIAWVLAGGYTLDLAMDELVDLHLETPRAALTAR